MSSWRSSPGTLARSFGRYIACGLLVAGLVGVKVSMALQCANGDHLSYTQTGNGPDIMDQCAWGFCEIPNVTGPLYSLDNPGCSPYLGSCAMTAEFDVEFPGNHQNDPPGFGTTFAVEQLFRSDGSTFVDSCGNAGQAIIEDFGIVLVFGTANCSNPSAGEYLLKTTSCPGAFPSSCTHTVSSPVDFAAHAGCVIPITQKCGTGDEVCLDCMGGGAPPDGSPSGFGGPGDPRTGGAELRYAPGGAGISGFPGSAEWRVTLGKFWSADYRERIIQVPDETHVFLVTKYGTYREFKSLDADTDVYGVAEPSSEKRTLTWLGASAGWTLTDLDGTVDAFDASGLWLSTTPPEGSAYATTATYSGGVLVSVSFPDGRSEEYAYYSGGDPSEGKLMSTTEYGIDETSHLQPWIYKWSGDDLIEIDRPDGTALLFNYDATTGFLAKVTLKGDDDISTRVLRAWSYNTDGKVEKVWKGGDTPAAGTEVWTYSYDSATQTTVTDPLGQPIVYTYGRDPTSQNIRVTQISGDCPVCGTAPNARMSYTDSNNPLLPTEIIDGRDVKTSFEYDPSGQMTSRTEASGDVTYERVTSWTYGGPYPALVTQMDQPSVSGITSFRSTAWTYDSTGNPTHRIISGGESGSTFSYETVTTYNAAGEPLSFNPPGYTTTDEVTFTYDPSRGDLLSLTRTDPLVGTPTSFAYDAFNRRTSVTDPNGLETTADYDELDRVTEVRQLGPNTPSDDLVTAYEYDTFGDLHRVTLPAGNVIEYGYDTARRLVSIERKADAEPTTHGERVLYTLDDAGNRKREERQGWDAGGSTWATVSATAYDYASRCQVDQVRQAPDTLEEAVTAFDYDCNGNLVSVWDQDHDRATDPPTTSYSYDPLNRLKTVSQPWEPAGATPSTAVTTYSYDAQDHLTSVTDAEGNTTSYIYSDRDLLTEEDSPASGATTHQYNEHGQEDGSTDARGIAVSRTIDERDRLASLDYPDDNLDTTYSYDTAPDSCGGASSPLGRLGQITRNGQTLDFCYDVFGRTTKDGELGYGYDPNGNRTAIVYPGGVSAAYDFDFADREVGLDVKTTTGGTPVPVVAAATYLANGPLSTLALGNGITEDRTFDGRRDPTGITLSGFTSGLPARTWTYSTDQVGNVTEIVETPECAGAGSTVILEDQTITITETYTSCADLQAGNNFSVQSPGQVTFQAKGTVVLTSGFSVGSGASFVAGALPELSHRTLVYQQPQYFLTGATGPWGTLDWSYDKIGNRLSESRDEGTSADNYVYGTNGSGGNTPILVRVNLAVMGTRNYTWDVDGNLDVVTAGANVVDFGSDESGRVSSVSSDTDKAVFTYDGRGFLRKVEQLQNEVSTRVVDPIYSSAGALQALVPGGVSSLFAFPPTSPARRIERPPEPLDLVSSAPVAAAGDYVFYFGARPVLILSSDGVSNVWRYLAADHLGAPYLATDDLGQNVWNGGFEPFGRDWQAGFGGASDNGVFLRLPGQWESELWSTASSGADLYYNVNRWYEYGTGRYTRPDPLGLLGPEDLEDTYSNLFIYGVDNPVFNEDPSGLVILDPDSKISRRCERRWRRKVLPRLLQLASNQPCTGFFCRQLNTDLPSLLTSTLPVINVYGHGATHGGHFDCPFSFNIDVGHGSFCSASVREAVHVVLHETAHFADCYFNGSRFPRIPLKPEEGCAAETACFGSSIGLNCKELGYPYDEP